MGELNTLRVIRRRASKKGKYGASLSELFNATGFAIAKERKRKRVYRNLFIPRFFFDNTPSSVCADEPAGSSANKSSCRLPAAKWFHSQEQGLPAGKEAPQSGDEKNLGPPPRLSAEACRIYDRFVWAEKGVQREVSDGRICQFAGELVFSLIGLAKDAKFLP